MLFYSTTLNFARFWTEIAQKFFEGKRDVEVTNLMLGTIQFFVPKLYRIVK